MKKSAAKAVIRLASQFLGLAWPNIYRISHPGSNAALFNV